MVNRVRRGVKRRIEKCNRGDNTCPLVHPIVPYSIEPHPPVGQISLNCLSVQGEWCGVVCML